jgi:hypothetical protein
LRSLTQKRIIDEREVASSGLRGVAPAHNFIKPDCIGLSTDQFAHQGSPNFATTDVQAGSIGSLPYQ